MRILCLREHSHSCRSLQYIYFLEREVSNKQYFAMFQLILKIIIISIFLLFYRSIGCGISSFDKKEFWRFKKPWQNLFMSKSSNQMVNSTMMDTFLIEVVNIA
jgi:hypothetical protein